MTNEQKDQIVRELHADPDGLWKGKVNGYRVTLFDFNNVIDRTLYCWCVRRAIVWKATHQKQEHTGLSETVWDAIEEIEVLDGKS